MYIIGGILKIVRLLAAGMFCAVAITGCTTATTDEMVQTPAVSTANAAPPSTAPRSKVLSGTFVSQAVPTSGEVTITQTPDSLVLELKDFSTSAGEELFLIANPGIMTKNAAGDNVVSDPTQYVLEKLRSTTGTQSYDLSYMIEFFPEARSITIYNSTTREAFGSANLQEK